MDEPPQTGRLSLSFKTTFVNQLIDRQRKSTELAFAAILAKGFRNCKTLNLDDSCEILFFSFSLLICFLSACKRDHLSQYDRKE